MIVQYRIRVSSHTYTVLHDAQDLEVAVALLGELGLGQGGSLARHGVGSVQERIHVTVLAHHALEGWRTHNEAKPSMN